MKKFSGVGVALVTPFDQNNDIDESSLRNLIDYVIEEGVDYLVALGTTSEVCTMTDDEKEYVVNVIANQNAGRKPIVIGVGCNNTSLVIKELQNLPYLSMGDAILSVTPYYNKPTQRGLYNHYKSIAEVSPLPIILYNVPSRTCANLEPKLVLQLANEFDNIIAVKEASGNFEQANLILNQIPDNFIFLSGDDCVALPLISIGSSGVISVIANVFPGLFSNMIHLGLEGEFDEARKIHLGLSQMYKCLFEQGNPAGVKAALHAKGIISHNKLRLPLCEVDSDLYSRIEALLP